MIWYNEWYSFLGKEEYFEYSTNMDSTKMNLNFNRLLQTKQFNPALQRIGYMSAWMPAIKSRTPFDNILCHCNHRPDVSSFDKSFDYRLYGKTYNSLLIAAISISSYCWGNSHPGKMKTTVWCCWWWGRRLNFKSHWIDSKEWFEKQLSCSVYIISVDTRTFLFIFFPCFSGRTLGNFLRK